MKKLFALFALLFVAFALVGCGGGDNNQPQGPDYDKVLAHAEKGYFVTGQNLGNWAPVDAWKMNAISINQVAALGAEGAKVAELLKARDVKYLYMKEIPVGQETAGWNAQAFIDGKNYRFDGSHAVKFIRGTWDEDGEKWNAEQWIHDPKTAHSENLTPDTYFVPIWQEAADENGYAWNSNPVVIGKQGTYYAIVADYDKVSSTDTFGFGVAFILKEEKATDLLWKEEIIPFVWADHTYGAIGSFNGWAADVALAGSEGVFTAEVELEENAEIKVRADGKWDVRVWGFGQLKDADAQLFASSGDDGSNIKVLTAGKYKVTLDFSEESDGVFSIAPVVPAE